MIPEESVFDRILDATVYFSFDRTGFERHAKRFEVSDLAGDISGRICLVTGANSGIGKATASALAARGARVVLCCRNPERAEQAARDIEAQTGTAVAVEIVDVSSNASVRAFVERFEPDRVDVLVNNAGVLPSERRLTEDGIELTWATNVVGPFQLTALLWDRLSRSDDPRVVNVSSGGMYTQRLSLSDLQWDRRPYDGVVAYAQTKRAEVILTELWARRSERISVHAMHPGWVDTPGVASSLPTFHRLTQGRLRTPEQGADTVVWLASAPAPGRSSGKFWFDRREAPVYPLPRTKERPEKRNELWRICVEQAKVSL